MKIFSSTNQQTGKTERLVGFHVTEEVEHKIILMSIGHGMSRASLIREVVMEWLNKKDPALAVAQQARALRNQKGSKWSNLTEAEYKEEIRADLMARKLPQKLITAVIEKYDEISVK